MHSPSNPILTNSFLLDSEPTTPIETAHRRIQTELPTRDARLRLAAADRVFPLVNCYQPPILWDRAIGHQVFDNCGNCWIDFTSTAVLTNTGHGHRRIRQALGEHAENGLLAQFSFASDIRIRFAETLVEIAPEDCDKVYFWTVGSEAIECAFRLAREFGTRGNPDKYHIVTFQGDYHGWTLAAHQMSGDRAEKPWLKHPDPAIHHLPFPRMTSETSGFDASDWERRFEQDVAQLNENGIASENVAAVVVESMQGWGALSMPVPYVQRLRKWADEQDVLLVFDEIQTGFGRTGRLFAYQHYEVRADLICVGKGVTSTLPLAAVLGPGEVLDLIPPGDLTTTHAAHPMACAAALANLQILEDENLVNESARKGEIAKRELEALQKRFPSHISEVSGRGLVHAIHVRDAETGMPGRELARDWTWAAVKHGVMLFQVNRPTLKICPPLIIPDDALVEGIRALGDALLSITS